MCALLRKIAALNLQGPVRLVLDNARYRSCRSSVVMALAQGLEHRADVFPSYSPIFGLDRAAVEIHQEQGVVRSALRHLRHSQEAIDGSLNKIETDIARNSRP